MLVGSTMRIGEKLSRNSLVLNFNNVEYGWNNFRKTICEVADGVLGKKVRFAAWNICEKALCLIERRRHLCKNYLNDRSYESKRNVKRLEKALKYVQRRCEVEAIVKIAVGVEDTARRHNSKIIVLAIWRVNKFRGSNQSRPVPVKDRNGATISDKERVKEKWVDHFENVLN